ncbi:UPF0764 protein C16orf89 homolog [Cimex lectularius]|uniref:Uncharacterized protein n=1 Tax=Cimex lectularius TaxID=79782 RepID=A0A8I6SQW1_CIMLE|nr:UPF0764 protein C16orf89 homolog [Cimex lectularius]
MRSSRLFLVPLLFIFFRTSRSNVYNVLDSLHSMLNYYSTHPDTVDHNLIFGVLIVKGEIGALKTYDDEEIKSQIVSILELCDKLLEKHPFDWSVTKYASFFMDKLSEGKDTENHLLKTSAIDYSVNEYLEYGSPSRSDSDMCLLGMLIDGEFKTECETIEKDPNAKGYTLIHQAIYFTLKSYLDEKEIQSSREIVHSLCERILTENRQIMKNGFPLKLQDLFVEQVAVCGLNQYREFLTDSTLRMILSLQTSRGCFAMREKQKHLQVNCQTHLSAVCSAALSNFLQYKLKAGAT